jgi:hypothetical protein
MENKMTNWYKEAKESDNDHVKMKNWFEKRTSKHIKSVQEYCQKIQDYDLGRFSGLVEQAKTHDQSKFENPELEPYVYTTWKYKCKEDGTEFECPDGMDKKMDEMTEHHVLNNRHHPEMHCGKKEGLINQENRDEPIDELIDGTGMTDVDLAEMCADWCAVSKERNNTPQAWGKKNINVRWKFSKDQEDLIYEMLDAVWKD